MSRGCWMLGCHFEAIPGGRFCIPHTSEMATSASPAAPAVAAPAVPWGRMPMFAEDDKATLDALHAEGEDRLGMPVIDLPEKATPEQLRANCRALRAERRELQAALTEARAELEGMRDERDALAARLDGAVKALNTAGEVMHSDRFAAGRKVHCGVFEPARGHATVVPGAHDQPAVAAPRVEPRRPQAGDLVEVCVLAPIRCLTIGRWVNARVSHADSSGFGSTMPSVNVAAGWRYLRHEGETWRWPSKETR